MCIYPFQLLQIDRYGYHPFITFKKEDAVLNALIDSGASCSFLHSDFFDISGTFSGEKQATGLGNDFPITFRLFEEITISGQSLSQIMISKSDLAVINNSLTAMKLDKIDGILGSDLLLYLEARIDFSQNMLFTKNYPKGIPFHYECHIFQPNVVITFNGQPLTMILDSGASQTLLDNNVAERLFPNTPAWESNEKPSIGISPEDILESAVAASIAFHTAPERWEANLMALRMHHINRAYTMLGIPPIDAILGADFLVKHHGCIDFQEKVLSFKRNKR